jgi:hypothetical protein
MSKELAQKALDEYTAMLDSLERTTLCHRDVLRAKTHVAISEAEGRAKVYLKSFAQHKRELGRLLREIASQADKTD